MLCKHEMTGRPQPPQHISPYFNNGAQISFSPAPKESHYLYHRSLPNKTQSLNDTIVSRGILPHDMNRQDGRRPRKI